MGKITIGSVKAMIKKPGKKVLFCLSLALAVLALVLVTRGPYISNQLKKLVLPELSSATGRQVMARKISISLFPLYIDARGLKVSEHGKEILQVPRIKGYVALQGLLRKELVLKRLVIMEPSVRTDESQVRDIIRSIKKYLEAEKKAPLKVVVKAIVLNKGTFVFRYGENSFSGNGFRGEAVINPAGEPDSARPSIPKLNFALEDLSSNIKGWPEIKSEVRGSLAVKDDGTVDIKGIQVGVYGSLMNASGTYGKAEGNFQVRLGLFMDSLKRLFGLKRRGEGQVSAKGSIRLRPDDFARSAVDMEIKGDLYLQTLMELLKVKERVEGALTFSGSLKGSPDQLIGMGKTRLKRGNLFDVDLDELTCTITYGDGKLNFTDGKGSLYGGNADAEAILSVRGPAYYSLHVTFSDVQSPSAFKLIRWDPGIPRGKVKGELSASGETFNPSGWFDYESAMEGKDFLGRVKKVRGSFRLNNDLLTLTDTEVNTPKTSIKGNGDVDLRSSLLSLRTEMKTADITDLTLPYLEDFRGSGTVSGTVTGKFDNPVISAKARFQNTSFIGYFLGAAEGEVEYRKDLLDVKDLVAVDTGGSAGPVTTVLKGSVGFPEAKEIFDFKGPKYALKVSVRNGDVERITRFVYKRKLEPYPSGRADVDFSITGKSPAQRYQGFLKARALKMGDLSADSLSSEFSYDSHDLTIKNTLVKKGDSTVTIDGSVSHDDRFSFKVSGSKVFLKDAALKNLPFDAYLTFRAEGRGTVDNPEIDLTGTIEGGRFRDVPVGDGSVKASLKGRALSLEAALFNDRVLLSGKADLTNTMPWTAHLDVRSGRYDFLLGSFLKDLPEDLLINLRGYAELSGDRDHFAAKALVDRLNMTVFGNSFSNDSEILFEVRDKRLALSPFTIRGGSIFFRMSGSMEVNKDYDLVIEGSSSMAPLKFFWKKIDTARGDAQYVFAITGNWDNPKISGGMHISDGVFSLKDLPYHISSLNGYVSMDEDRIMIEKLSCKIGGGSVELSGVAYLKALKLQRFHTDAVLNNVGLELAKDFPANISGNLLYTGTRDSQTLSGDVRINRAAYRQPIEWKSWLLKAKAMEKPRGEIGALEKTRLNVRVEGADDIIINNNMARASLKVDMVLRGTLASPLLFGRVETKTGIVFFRNNEFRILNATADFSDPKRINPVMNITAETTVQGYDIRMSLEGQLDHFTMALSSNPSLEEIEILSLLTVGTLSKGVQGGMGYSAATSFLSGQVQDLAQERVKSITGLDRIGMESSVSKVTGKPEQRLVVAKRLIGDKLSVTYSTSFSSVATDIIRIEYNIGTNVSLIGQRDEAGGFGGGIKFRFGFK